MAKEASFFHHLEILDDLILAFSIKLYGGGGLVVSNIDLFPLSIYLKLHKRFVVTVHGQKVFVIIIFISISYHSYYYMKKNNQIIICTQIVCKKKGSDRPHYSLLYEPPL